MLKEDTQGQSKRFAAKFVWQAVTDYKTYVQSGIYMGMLIPLYAIALFTPTIVNELGALYAFIWLEYRPDSAT